MKILEKKGERIKFLVSGMTTGLAGELRRIMISEIPTMAIEWVDFHKNDSVLWNEILAHRLGLIPLTFDLKFFNPKDGCKCRNKGCVHCQVKLSLKKKGPCTVYSEDMKFEDEKIKPIYSKIPIVELMDGQELELEAIAQLGTGREHAKWQGAVVGYEKDKKDNFVFNVESVCGLRPEEIIIQAFEVLSSKLKDFSTDLKRIK